MVGYAVNDTDRDFIVIYKILSALQAAMDSERLDTDSFAPDILGVTPNRLYALLEMLSDEGYIKGLVVTKRITGTGYMLSEMKITLRGLEYLKENSLMNRALQVIRGIVPSLIDKI